MSQSDRILLLPDVAFDASGTRVPAAVLVESGVVAAVGHTALQAIARRVPLPGKMLLPGFANVHSHAFQRVLRGRVERRSRAFAEDDFWTWRTHMYHAANHLSPADIETVAEWCYLDNLRSGFVSVGEFHYVHHSPSGTPYASPPELSARIARAAARLGIRLTLLQTGYARAGADAPARPDQRRFVFPDVSSFLRHAQEARERVLGERLRHGLAIHSVRACGYPWLEGIAEEARAHGLPIHVHACEQLAEIEACRAEYRVTPIEILARAGVLGPNTSLIHATHLEERDPRRIADQGALVCVCPSTERNLGDGLCHIRELVAAGVRLAVGTDSHARIDVADELRSLEDHERLRLQRRNVLTAPGGTLGEALLPHGVTHGAQSLGWEAPDLRVGAPADLISVTLPVEGEVLPEVALDAWLVGGSSRDVQDVFIAGEQLLADRIPTRVDEVELRARVRDVLQKLPMQ